MLRFLADENLNDQLVRGLRRRLPDVDIVRAREVGLSGVPDPEALEDLSLLVQVATPDDFERAVIYLPLRS